MAPVLTVAAAFSALRLSDNRRRSPIALARPPGDLLGDVGVRFGAGAVAAVTVSPSVE